MQRAFYVEQEGLDLKGKEGTIIEVIEKLNGKPLSANLPYKTQFLLPLDGGKDQKLIAHLVTFNSHLQRLEAAP